MGIQNQITFTIIITTFLIAYNGVSAINDSLSEGVQNSTIDSADQPSADNVYNDIQTISNWYRYLDTSGHREAENYIFSKFESFGLNVSRQEYTANRMDGSVRAVNVLGLLEGDIEPWKWLVIAGHYDANQRSTHGAYDNAAGAASVIELARYIVGSAVNSCTACAAATTPRSSSGVTNAGRTA